MHRLLDAAAFAAAVDTLADRLHVRLPHGPLAVVGVRTGGVVLADRLAAALTARGRVPPARGDVDITLYRDDLYTGLERPVLGHTSLPFQVDGTGVVLVDDVLFTGRTIRAALGELYDWGRPAYVRLAVLVDRGHRELPIAADFVGVTVRTELRDRVDVRFSPDEVWVETGR